MAETAYFKDKVYLPREVREKLGLANGDRLYIEVIGRGEARLTVTRAGGVSRRILGRLNDPPDMGRLKEITRKQIYEDIA